MRTRDDRFQGFRAEAECLDTMQERGFIPFELRMVILAVRANSEFLQTSRDIHGASFIFRFAEAPWHRAERLRSRDGPVSDYLIFGLSS
jgi:hypothetical protein